MNSTDCIETNANEDPESFLEKIALFKEKHLQLRNLCIELINENEILRNKVQSVESQFPSRGDDSTNAIIKQQQRIIELLKNKDDNVQLKAANNDLSRRIEDLENQIEKNKIQYEQEIQKLLQKCNVQANEINRMNERNVEEESELRREYDDLRRKNEELGSALQSLEIETGQAIASLDMKHQNEVMILKSENQTLLDELRKQERLHKQKLQSLENDIKSKGELIRKLTSGRNKITLDAAFNTSERILETKTVPISAKKSVSCERRFSPMITDDDSMENM